jgi:sugar phosphate isomerase/epimerase
MLNTVKGMGLVVTCLTARNLPSGGRERDDFFEDYLDLCNDMDCGLMKISSDPAWCREAAIRAEVRGVTLASNNHVGGQLETVNGTREFFNAVNHPNFGLLYDCMHLMVSGEDYLGCIPEFFKFTKNILIQSRRRVRAAEKGEMIPSGREWMPAFPDDEGVQDWPNIFKRFRQQGYDGLITVIENSWPANRREEVARKCCPILREMWNAANS